MKPLFWILAERAEVAVETFNIQINKYGNRAACWLPVSVNAVAGPKSANGPLVLGVTFVGAAWQLALNRFSDWTEEATGEVTALATAAPFLQVQAAHGLNDFAYCYSRKVGVPRIFFPKLSKKLELL